MTGYTRNDSANNIADGNIINASDLDGEFDAIQTAFGTSGHTHDGTAGNGPQIANAGLADDAVTGAKIDSTTTITAAGFTGPLTGNVTGNASTASALASAVNIAGNSFDGSSSISIATTDLTDGTTAVTATSSEVNILDGDTTASAVTLADADRIVVNDAGTMKQVAVTALTPYLEGKMDTLSGLSSTISELNKLDGYTGTYLDLNYAKDLRATGVTTIEFDTLDGLTASTTELNYNDITTLGTVQASKTVTADGSGNINFSNANMTNVDVDSGTIDNTTIGGTTKAAGSFTNLTATGTFTLGSTAVTSTAAELNILDGATVTTAELNVLDGIPTSLTATELGYLDTVTSNVQTQLNAKQATVTGAATTITGSNLTASRALVANTSGKVAVSDITSTELGYLDGVSSNIQTQLNSKGTGTVSSLSDLGITATATEINYTDGVTSNIQTQLNNKEDAGGSIALAIALG